MEDKEKPGELRCPRRLHAKLDDDGVLEVYCRYCSTHHAHVYHRWDITTREELPDRVESERWAAA